MTTVYIIDDDASVRKSMKRLMESAGLHARTFASGEEFLDARPSVENACVVIDMRMRGLTGLELQKRLTEERVPLPVIFVTAHDTEESRSEARAAGAAGYFQKPIDDQALLDAIAWALSKNKA